MKRRNIPSPGHCTGKRLGVLTVVNYATIHQQRKTRQPEQPIYTDDELLRMREEVYAKKDSQDIADYLGYLSINDWIQKKRPLAEGLIQQANASYFYMMGELCQIQMAEKVSPYLASIKEAGLCYDLPASDSDKGSPLRDLQMTLQEMVSCCTVESYLEDNGSGNPPAIEVLRRRDHFFMAYYGLVGFNDMMDTIAKVYQLPEVSFYKVDTDSILDLAKRINIQILSLTYQLRHTKYATEEDMIRKLRFLAAAFPLFYTDPIRVPASRRKAIRDLMQNFKAFTEEPDELTRLVFTPPSESSKEWEV